MDLPNQYKENISDQALIDIKHNPRILHKIKTWFEDCLGCVQGRREFMLKRYLFDCVRNSEDIKKLYNAFKENLTSLKKVGCLFVFDNPRYQKASEVPYDQILAEMSRMIANGLGITTPKLEGVGESLSVTIKARCPVTNTTVVYDDFDVVAFLPHAEDTTHPFYDPSTEAPVACANLASDIFAFSMFVRDQALTRERCEVWQMNSVKKITDLLKRSVEIWQRLAIKSISNFAARTDPKVLCPMFFSNDKSLFYAPHEESAFGESKKQLHAHQMPIIYAKRIIMEFIRYFENGIRPTLTNIACKGEPQGT